ncbi:MAG: GNAT family N-acetyltransferase [bacterium]
MKKISIREYSNYNHDEIIKLYKAVGWSNYYEKPEILKSGFENSLYVLGAYADEGELVGIIRVVGDGYSIVYIQDILVLPDYQHKKIGSNLLLNVLEKYKNVYQINLSTDNTQKTVNFYKSLGFKDYSDINCVAFMYFGK